MFSDNLFDHYLAINRDGSGLGPTLTFVPGMALPVGSGVFLVLLYVLVTVVIVM